MDIQNPTPNQGPINTPPAQPTPQAVPPTPPPAQPTPPPVQPAAPQTVIVQKSSPWPWIIGGCLTVVILVGAAFLILGWWGAKKVKNEIDRYQPTAQEMQKNLDKINQETQEWEKRSEEMRNSLPNPEDLQNQMNNIK